MSYSEKQVKEIFFEEMREIFEKIDVYLLAIEDEPDNLDVIKNLFREVHTLKGSSGVFGFREISSLTHHAEDLLDNIREGNLKVTEEIISSLLECFDRLKEMMDAAQEEKDLKAFQNEKIIEDLSRFLQREGAQAGSDRDEKINKIGSKKEKTEKFCFSITEAEKFFIMGIDPVALILNAKDIAVESSFHVFCYFDKLKELQNSDPEKCDTDFLIYLESSEPAEKVLGVFDFISDDTGFSYVEGQKAQEQLEEGRARYEKQRESLVKGALDDAKPSSNVQGGKPVSQKKDVGDVTPQKEGLPMRVPPGNQAEAKPTQPRKDAPTTAGKSEDQKEKVAKKSVDAKKTDSKQAIVTPKKTKSGETTEFLRIKKEKLDQLMNLVGELITVKNLFVHLGNLIEAELPGDEIAKIYKEGTGTLSRLSSRLQESVMNARMVPMGTVFTKYTRLVRDVSKKLGKKVNLVIEGEDTELDKTVSEAISDPIMHLIRNAIDHGIEQPEEREAKGKSPYGNILLKSGYEGNNVKIIIKDDGNGIDPEKIRSKVLRLGLCSAENLAGMNKREIVDFIFHSGFSTTDEVTDISGRGVGMDVVRNNIRKSSGNIVIDSNVGKGTEFRILLPLSLAVLDALLIGCGQETYALPQEVIIESVRVQPDDINMLNSQPSITLRHEVIPVIALKEHVSLEESVLDDFIASERARMSHEDSLQAGKAWDGSIPIVIVQIDDVKVGILVDELYWQEQIMIKPLGGFLSSIQAFSGACIMGNGNVVLVLDPKELYTSARTAERKVA